MEVIFQKHRPLVPFGYFWVEAKFLTVFATGEIKGKINDSRVLVITGNQTFSFMTWQLIRLIAFKTKLQHVDSTIEVFFLAFLSLCQHDYISSSMKRPSITAH